MFKYETKAYKFLAWASVAAMALRALCLVGGAAALILFFIPSDISANTVSRLAIASILTDFVALAFIFFANFQTKFFRKRTVWSILGSAAILLLALVLCVVMVAFESGTFGAIACEILAYLLIGTYMFLPGYFTCRDVFELFSRLKAEANEREKSVAERVRDARRY